MSISLNSDQGAGVINNLFQRTPPNNKKTREEKQDNILFDEKYKFLIH